MSPFDLDMEKEPGIANLQKIFAAELVYSVQLKKSAAFAGDDNDEINDN